MILIRFMLTTMLALQSPAPAAQPAPAPTALAQEASRYRFDLERNFFSSPAVEIAGRAGLEHDANALLAAAGRMETAADLLAAFEAEDRLQRLFRRHDLYLFLRYAVDIGEEEGMQAADALRARVRAARQAIRRAIVARDPAWMQAALAAEPRLARYAAYVDSVRRDAPHLLSSEQQAVVAALEPQLGAADYPRVVNGLTFGTIEADGRILDARRDSASIDASPSPQTRRDGSRLLFAGYSAQRELLAFLLVRAVGASEALARLRGHASAEAEAAFGAWVTPQGYEALLAAVASRGGDYKAWQRRAANPLASADRWTPERAAAAIVESAGALGPDYQREFAALLNPANGRADLAGSSGNRLPLVGTASVYPTGSSAIYMRDFQGTLLDLIVLAHEGGHAVQAQLMFRSEVPMAYAAGPGYFTESFGRFQELLLLDHLYRAARAPEARARLRDAFAARLLAVFPSAEEAAVELAIHTGVREGRIRTADDMDAATATAGGPYSIEYEQAPERRGLWMLSEGYFMAPMQELNDAYASLLAVRYFQLYRRDPRRFRTAYLALLSNGYPGAPADLLRTHLGIDIESPGFATHTLGALRTEVDGLYR